MIKTEFLIVGSGLAGTLLAFEMLENHLDFRILSSQEKPQASDVAAGMFNPLVFKRLTKSWMADTLLPVMSERYHHLENLLGQQFYFEKDILKPLSQQEKLLWLERRLEPEFSKYIISITKTTSLSHLVKAPGYGRVSGSGYVALTDFLDKSKIFFKRKNLLINDNFDFSKIKPADDKFKIAGVQASKVIFCEGAHIKQNPYFDFVKIKPTKGEILQVYIPDLSEDFILNKQVFVLPIGNHRFKVGSTYDWKDTDWRTTEEGKLSITERLQKLISTNYKIENQWAGIRPATTDRRPVLGAHPKFSNIYLFNGLGTKGVMLAPYFAREMIHLLADKNYSINSEVNIRRFI